MQKTAAVSIAIALALACVPASAQEHTTAMSMGVGVMTCAQFAQYYQSNVNVESDFFNWAQGHMTGMNGMFAYAKSSTRDLDGIPVADEKTHLRDYCSTHPLDEYMTAVIDLYFSLPLVKPPAVTK